MANGGRRRRSEPLHDSHAADVRSLEAGFSSPAVVHDVVLVSTSPPPYGERREDVCALRRRWALLVDEWRASCGKRGVILAQWSPAIYGNYVVVGVGTSVLIYKLGPLWRFPHWPIYEIQWPPFNPPDPPWEPWPGPDPEILIELERAKTKGG